MHVMMLGCALPLDSSHASVPPCARHLERQLIKQRVEIHRLAKERAPDVVCLQEIKCVDDAFPRETFEALGYNVAVHGQKAFNGAAILPSCHSMR